MLELKKMRVYVHWFSQKYIVIYEEQLIRESKVWLLASNGPLIVKSSSFCKYAYCDSLVTFSLEVMYL